MTKNLFYEIADLRKQEREIKAKLEELIPAALAELVDKDIERQPIDGGIFTVKKLKVWKYPDFLEEAKKKIKEAELDAQRLGTATYVEKPSLVFSTKEDER